MRVIFFAVGISAVSLFAPTAGHTEEGEAKLVSDGYQEVATTASDWIGTWQGVNKHYEFVLREDGSADFTFGQRHSEGQWSAEDGALCTAWKEFRPRKRCDRMFQKNDEYTALKPDGTIGDTIKRAE